MGGRILFDGCQDIIILLYVLSLDINSVMGVRILIVWAASGRHVVTNISQWIANNSAIGNVVVSGNVTNLGRKLLALVELETYS